MYAYILCLSGLPPTSSILPPLGRHRALTEPLGLTVASRYLSASSVVVHMSVPFEEGKRQFQWLKSALKETMA